MYKLLLLFVCFVLFFFVFINFDTSTLRQLQVPDSRSFAHRTQMVLSHVFGPLSDRCDSFYLMSALQTHPDGLFGCLKNSLILGEWCCSAPTQLLLLLLRGRRRDAAVLYLTPRRVTPAALSVKSNFNQTAKPVCAIAFCPRGKTKQVRFVSVKAERPNHPSRGGVS